LEKRNGKDGKGIRREEEKKEGREKLMMQI